MDLSTPTGNAERRAPRTLERLPAELSTPDAWLDPFDWYAGMRETAPVRYDESRRAWDVFRYEDASRILADPVTFSSDPTLARDIELPPPDERSPILDTMLLTDGARHDRLRSVVEASFRPRALATWAPRIEALAEELLGAVADRGEMDVVHDLAYPLPVVVIAELLGVPSEDRPTFKRWSDTLVETPTDTSEAGLASFRRRQERASRELTDYFEAILETRRVEPRDDLVSEIVHAEVDGLTLTHQEQLGFCMLLLVAGNITTTNLIGNAVRCLTDHPAAMARLVAEPSLLPSAVEEVLRYRSPVQALVRHATRDVELSGARIRAGDSIVVWLGAANRDPAVFEAPDEFRIDRAPNPHLGFGRGTHYCLGAPLARLEARIAVNALLASVSDVERDGEALAPVRSSFIYGVRRLPVQFRRRSATGQPPTSDAAP